MRVIGFVLLLLIAPGCATPEAEETATEPLLEDAGAPPRAEGAWALAGGASLRLSASTLILDQGSGEWAIAEQVYGAATIDGHGARLAYCRRGDGIDTTAIEVWQHDPDAGTWTGPRRLADGDRPALSADGEWLAYVSGVTGIASIWLIPFTGGEPVQLTNVGVGRPDVPGQPPAGFVPPPHRGPPSFDGDRLGWEAPDGSHAVDLP